MANASRESARSEAQRERLLDAAARVFLRHGFGITTVDVIAAEAKASKKTLYAHFASKEEIFDAALRRVCEQTLAPLHELEIVDGDPETVLVLFGTRYLAQVLTPDAIAVYRVAISEATRFPEFSRLFYRDGPATVQGLLRRHLVALRDGGQLNCPDPDGTAALFIHMVAGEMQRRVVLGVSEPPSAKQAAAHVAAVATLLLRALR